MKLHKSSLTSILFSTLFCASIALLLSTTIAKSQADTINDLLGVSTADAADQVTDSNKVITTQNTAQSDKKIKKRLKEIYAELDNLNQLSVDVNKGIIDLKGEVSSSTDEKKAIDLAKQIEGVVEVKNELVVTRSIEKRLEATSDKAIKVGKDFIINLPLIFIALFVFIASWMLGGWLSRRQRVFRRITPNHFIANLLGQVTHLVMIIIGLVLALSLLDATALLGTIMGAAGIFGLAIGFAVRDTVENYIASILLSLRNPFQVNDLVEISGRQGNVARLTTRATILISADGNHIRIPNAEVFKAVIVNYTRNPERRFQFDLGVDSTQDLNAAQQLAVETLNTMEGVMNEPKPMALVDSLGDFNVIIRVYGWVNQQQFSFGKVSSEAIKRTKLAFDDADIIMPEPIYQIRVSDTSTLHLDQNQQLNQLSQKDSKKQTADKPKEPITATPNAKSDTPLKIPKEVPADLKPDKTVKQQVQEEYANSGNENLLSQQTPSE